MRSWLAIQFEATSRWGIRALLLVILLLLLTISLPAESPSFKVYTTQEGLAHDLVNNIVRDSRGFLWFCTSEGLSRFDGSRFTNFTTDQGLPHRNVWSFFETSKGIYLVGTSFGVAVFDPNGTAYRWNVLEQRLEQSSNASPMFRTYLPNGVNRQTNVIYGLAEDVDGSILVGTGFGLFRGTLSDEGMTFDEIKPDDGRPAGYYRFLLDGEGGVLSVTSWGISRIYNGKLELLDRPGAGSIMRAADGKIWIGASGEPTGIRVYEFKSGKLTLIEHYTTKDGLLWDTFQRGLWQMEDGTIFVGLEAGFQQFIPDAKDGEPKFRTFGRDVVNALAEDPVGNLWLGTELKGAWQLIRSGFVSFGEKDGIAESEDIRSIYIDPAGEVFLPTRPTRILHLNENGIFSGVAPYGVTGRSWGWSNLDFRSRDGEWWVPGNDGLRRYPKVARFEDLSHTPPTKIYTKKDGLHGNEAFMLFEDSHGDVWITTDAGGGEDCLARWDHNTSSIVAYFSADGLPKNTGPVSYTEDKSGNVWIGFYFGGVARYKDGKFQFFSQRDGMSESMPGALYVDDDGKLWIGTTGQGLFRVDDPGAERPVFTNISTREGLSSNHVICLTGDRFHQVYAGTGRGINRVDQGGNIDVFTQADGLPSNYITRCARDPKGALWFVSRNTLVRYTPEQRRAVIPDAVYIDKVSVNGNAQKISVLGETDIELPDLSSNQNQVQVNFFALTYGAGENIRYQYQLDEQGWSQPTAEQTINLNLSPDRHVFAVRAVLSNGVTSARSAVLSMRILRPLWQRSWFLTLITALVCGIVFLVYRYRTQNLRRINAALREANIAEEALRRAREDRVAELEQVRSRIATDLHDDIGASLTQIAVLSEVARAQTGRGNGRPPESLRKISDVSNELVGTMSDIVWSINPEKDRLSDLTQRMRRFASDLLTAKEIAFQFHAPDVGGDFVVRSNTRREVFLIFKESVNNVVKHSQARNVEIELVADDREMTLTIADDGIGIDAVRSRETSGGNGLLSMKRRARALKADLEVSSADGKGTIVTLRVPLDQIHATSF